LQLRPLIIRLSVALQTHYKREKHHAASEEQIRKIKHFFRLNCRRVRLADQVPGGLLEGIKTMSMIRKGRVRWVTKGDVVAEAQFITMLLAIAA